MDDLLARLSTALDGRYRIGRPLGEGGMALVFLAEDLKHKRNVALKVLRPELAAILGAQRFLKEIEVTAGLQHPNILPLYDSGEADTFLYYVMPLMEGETLREKLDKERQLPVEEAVEIARSVASALDYAHRHNVLHRDIKPSNILLHEGQALVADFGIALAMRNASGETRLTETGLSIGTPHYMSPEQAVGDRDLDARSDLYSLAAVTYEMLVGEPPHVAKSAQALMAKILSDTPAPIRRTRELIPGNVEAAVAKALARSPADRFSTAADFGAALGNVGFTWVEMVGPGSAAPAPGPLQRLAPVLAASTAVALALVAWGWLRPEAPATVARYSLAFQAGQELVDELAPTFTVAAGGAALVYVGPGDGGPNRLWVKWRDRTDAVALPGTEGATFPAVSPDAQEVVYFTDDYHLSKVSLQGGAPITLTDSAHAYGVAWLDDGSLLFLPRRVVAGHEHPPHLGRIPASGGMPTVIGPTNLGDTLIAVYPAGLPGSKGALFTACWDCAKSSAVWAVDLESGEGHEVLPGAVRAWYVESGHMVYVRPDGAVFGVPFDVGKLEVTGPAVPLLENVRIQGSFLDMELASDGTLLMMTGGTVDTGGFDDQEVVWVNREGLAQPVDGSWSMQNAKIDGADNLGWALSPDGTRLAIALNGPEGNDIWIKELDDGPLLRLTHDPAEDARPRWSRDGQRVSFVSLRRERVSELYVQRADGAGDPEPVLVEKGRSLFDTDETSDGAWLVARVGGVIYQTGGRDVVAWHIEGGDTTEVPLLTSDYDEVSPKLSPDGRWLAYASQESGKWQVNVRPFPDVNSGRWVVSRGPAANPSWSRDGTELFYLAYDADGLYTMMTATVETRGGFRVVDRTELFPLPDGVLVSRITTSYDVTPDGQRFIMVRARGTGDQEGQAPIILVENWLEEVKAKMRGSRGRDDPLARGEREDGL